MHNGSVKWFNNAKGYGFIISEEFDEDLFIHYSAINVEGYKTLKAGQSVTFNVEPGNRGLHATEITPDAESVSSNTTGDAPKEAQPA
ncbi:cold shock domain-containing protein [Marinomonas transparens]|uniref:Cold shock domain-containing protein n=1 Tax=Marinomonas transparens TaxID=2795388 RepID=A0A934JSQ1_9GAMM|nr:cold shock domain-containing protein [Marinomonas transparens]MBJ7536675.1 cold shock domain-containing protein [Marinomonas transparens]